MGLTGQKLATLFDAKVNKRRFKCFEGGKIHKNSIILLSKGQKIPIICYFAPK